MGSGYGRGFRVFRSRRSIPAGMACIALAAPAWAANADTPDRFTFGGFGTFGVVHSNEHEADFVGELLQPDGAGYTHDWSADTDTRLGLQFTAALTPKLSSVVQVMVEYDHEGKYSPKLEWANLNYNITDNFSVRAGRIVLPMFAVSDTRKVGYAQPWVRPPREVYSLMPVTSSDGASFRYRINTGDYTHTVEGSFGQNDQRPPAGIDTIYSRDMWGLSWSLEHGFFNARVAHQQVNVSASNALFDAFRLFGAQGDAVANRYDFNDSRYRLDVLSVSYDPGSWFVSSELGHAESATLLGNTTGWYVGAGRRFGPFTLYVNHADAKSSIDVVGLDLSQVPPSMVGMAAGLNAALAALLNSAGIDQTNDIIGGRWDFASNAALKLQLDYIQREGTRGRVYANAQPGLQPDGSTTLISIAVDFVF